MQMGPPAGPARGRDPSKTHPQDGQGGYANAFCSQITHLPAVWTKDSALDRGGQHDRPHTHGQYSYRWEWVVHMRWTLSTALKLNRPRNAKARSPERPETVLDRTQSTLRGTPRDTHPQPRKHCEGNTRCGAIATVGATALVMMPLVAALRQSCSVSAHSDRTDGGCGAGHIG